MILQAKNLHRTINGRTLLKGIDLEIEKGQSISICGRSGEGKTTLLHILGGLDTADEGEIWICKEKLSPKNRFSIANRHLGFIFQGHHLLEDFTVLENVLLPQRIARKNPSRSEGLALLDRVFLAHLADEKASILSGGEKQRVAIARALANHPSLILADEPTGNLDQALGQSILELLLSFQTALLMVTHDPLMGAYCKTQLLLKEGSLIYPT